MIDPIKDKSLMKETPEPRLVYMKAKLRKKCEICRAEYAFAIIVYKNSVKTKVDILDQPKFRKGMVKV